MGDFYLSEVNLIGCHLARIVWASEGTQNKKNEWQCFPFAEGRGYIQLKSQGDHKTSDHTRRSSSKLLRGVFPFKYSMTASLVNNLPQHKFGTKEFPSCI